MNRHLILATVSRFLVLLLCVSAVFLLLRGHNEPGGGFIGGLLMAGAFVTYALGNGVERTRELLHVKPETLVAAGLLLALSSGCLALVLGQPFMTGQWLEQPLPGVGKVSSVLLFDIGVFLTVFGTVLRILFTVEED